MRSLGGELSAESVYGDGATFLCLLPLPSLESVIRASRRAEVAREPGPAYEIGLRAFGTAPSMMAEVGRLQEAMACLRHLRLQGRVIREALPSGLFRWSPGAA